MKRLTVASLLFCALLGNFLNGQIIYNDALFLKGSQTDASGKILLDPSVKKLLKNYFPLIKEDMITADFIDKSNNDFFKLRFVDDTTKKALSRKYKAKKTSSGIEAIDVTNISKGISLFLIDRAKQELNIAFFQKFKNLVDKYPEISILLPNTTSALGNLLAYQYSQMLPVLQEAFYSDVKILPENLVEVLLMPKYYYLIHDSPEFLVILRSINLLRQLDNFKPPQFIDTLHAIAEDYGSIPQLENLHSTLKLISIFSNSIRTEENKFIEDEKNYWISPKELNNNILEDSYTFNLFLGLLYQEIKNNNIIFNKKPLIDSLNNKQYKIEWFKIQYSVLVNQVNEINTIAKRISELHKLQEKLTNQDIYAFLSTTISLIDFGSDIIKHFYPKSEYVDVYIDLANNATNLYMNTVSQNYALAMNNAIFIINAIGKEIVSQEDDAIKQSKKDQKVKGAVRVKGQKYTGISKNIFVNDVLSKITTYGTFVANMADAESPEEVQAAIELAALPAGSSSFKKHYTHNVALNAYLGLNAGNWPKEESSSLTWNENFKLTAPIGFTYTPFSFGKCGALSLFASVLDVGAIVDYQLNNDSTKVDQKIYLSNIFSPGGYIVYGMAYNWPISVGFGGQYGPGLIKMEEDLWDPAWRWNFFLTVDIPIFNLYKGRGIIERYKK